MTVGHAWDDRDVRDPIAYETAIREVSGAVPDDAVDWNAFHARLAVRAELSLVRLRHPRPPVSAARTRVHVFPRRLPPQRSFWWQHAARWSCVVVTGALAASVVLVLDIRATPKESHLTPSVGTVATTVIDGDRSRAAFESAVVGHVSPATIASTLLPSAAELLIPLGGEAASR